MIWLVLGLIFLLVAVVIFVKGLPPSRPVIGKVASVTLLFVALICFASTSYVYVGGNQVAHLKRIYGGSSLPAGRLIALSGENGFQSRILSPGFHFEPLLTVINDVSVLPMVEVPPGFYGLIEARDGNPLPSGAAFAAPWPEDEVKDMLDASYFLQNGGQKGLQTTVLKPGVYPLNLYLFRVKIGEGNVEVTYDLEGRTDADGSTDTLITEIPAGFVGVVKSNVQERPGSECKEITNSDVSALSVALVPRGCKGIWESVLNPDAYYINREAYDVTLVDTRVQTWKYRGGYVKRSIKLNVDQQGKIGQTETTDKVVFNPNDDADRAIVVKVEGWEIPQEVRVLVQVTRENAPYVVASVGSLREIEDRVLTPTIRSIVRDVAGGSIQLPRVDGGSGYVVRKTRVLDLIENREALQNTIERKVRVEGDKAGINIKEVRLGEPVIPPELLVARQREQLASQLAAAYQQEKLSQDERIKTEKSRATANQQSELVKAEIDVEISEKRKLERKNLGEAEKSYLTALADGQMAQAQVLGEDRVVMLQALEKFLATLERKPQLVELVSKLVPEVYVSGDGADGLGGAAAILRGTGMFSGSEKSPN
ncbi:SPFH domain-containing protein [Thalassospira sp.]|uniref:SPFH domain-containing protein n=1 Tax=Thalassospira sp. TaxID=1912094 RepID=UPI00311F6E08